MSGHTYPKALMANIEAAKLGAVNHYTVADEVLAIAKFDVNMATRHGSHIVANTLRGNVVIYRTEQRGFYKVMVAFNDVPAFEGPKAETINFMAGLYRLEAGQ